jgi:hypothetical protein
MVRSSAIADRWDVFRSLSAGHRGRFCLIGKHFPDFRHGVDRGQSDGDVADDATESQTPQD